MSFQQRLPPGGDPYRAQVDDAGFHPTAAAKSATFIELSKPDGVGRG